MIPNIKDQQKTQTPKSKLGKVYIGSSKISRLHYKLNNATYFFIDCNEKIYLFINELLDIKFRVKIEV